MPSKLKPPLLVPDSPFVSHVAPSPNYGERQNGMRPDMLILHYTGMPPAKRQSVAWRRRGPACPVITSWTRTARSPKWCRNLFAPGTPGFRIGKASRTSIPAPSGSRSTIPVMTGDIPIFRMRRWRRLKRYAGILSIATGSCRAAFSRIPMSLPAGRSIRARNSIGQGWLWPGSGIGSSPLT